MSASLGTSFSRSLLLSLFISWVIKKYKLPNVGNRAGGTSEFHQPEQGARPLLNSWEPTPTAASVASSLDRLPQRCIRAACAHATRPTHPRPKTRAWFTGGGCDVWRALANACALWAAGVGQVSRAPCRCSSGRRVSFLSWEVGASRPVPFCARCWSSTAASFVILQTGPHPGSARCEHTCCKCRSRKAGLGNRQCCV